MLQGMNGMMHQSPPLTAVESAMPVPFFNRKRFYSSINDSAARFTDQNQAKAFCMDNNMQFDGLSASNISTNFSNLSGADKFESEKKTKLK